MSTERPKPQFARAAAYQPTAELVAAHPGFGARSPVSGVGDGKCGYPEHRFLADVLDSISFPVYVIDARTYRIVLANRATCAGQLPPDMTCHALTHNRSTPCHDAQSPCPIEEAKTTKKHVVVEHMHHSRYGVTRRLEVHAFPLVDSDGDVSHVIEQTIDVTERRQAEEELLDHQKSLEMLVAALERSNEELRSFAGIAAHDMRSPMAMISASATLLKDILAERLDEEANDVLDILMTAVERTMRMITSIYRCSQVDARAPSLTKVDLNRIVEEVEGVQLAAELRKSHGTIHVPERLHVVVGDEMQILQLMQNLLGNGLKYHRPGVAPQVTVRSRQAGADRVRIEVEDNGIGIREADREKVFGMFNRLSDASDDEGLGIGLALCRKVAERHGGRIGVTSVYGSGSTFWVELPMANG